MKKLKLFATFTFSLGVVFSVLSGCGGTKLKSSTLSRKNISNGESAAAQKQNGNYVKDMFDGNSTTSNLVFAYPSLLGPEALEQVYKPVFGEQVRAKSNSIQFFKDFPNQYFSPAERTALGEYSVAKIIPGTRVLFNSSLKIKTDLDIVYLGALRSFLGDACTKLIDKENNLPVTERTFLQNTPVQAKKINSFLLKLMREPQSENTETLLPGVQEYAITLDSLLLEASKQTDDTKKKASVRSVWLEFCTSISSDARVFLR